MAKRKAGVNDIIYELDNDDNIEVSSEDEGKQPKINRLEAEILSENTSEIVTEKHTPLECICIDCSEDLNLILEESPTNGVNGGKSPIVIVDIDEEPKANENEIDKQTSEISIATISNEDIALDSPTSNSDLGVAGCENRSPLFTVRFKNSKVARAYKEKVKAFMLKLIRLHDEKSLEGSENETDLELDIWPEDLQEAEKASVLTEAPIDLQEAGPVSAQAEAPAEPDVEDNLFFIDTDPSVEEHDIPRYRPHRTLICNVAAKRDKPPIAQRRGPTCFNCEGPHPLRDCTLPRDNAKIAGKRKAMARVGRYHVEDEQKYGHLVPGRISGNLRHALGTKRSELPLYLYRMRMLGYPPGWLEEARISHSGITMFDSSGSAIQDPEEEEGELNEPGSKDKFDIKKILDFPGFNVPASGRYKEEAHLLGLPPMSEQDSKIAMLQMLAPNAMKAYKRKKLTFFPSAGKVADLDGHAEMELDSGDEVAEFPSVPPLPDDAPPPPPPPPPPEAALAPETSEDELQIVEVTEVNDIPMPADISHISIEDSEAEIDVSSGRDSPSLDDLEEKKKRLLSALDTDVTVVNTPNVSMSDSPPIYDLEEKKKRLLNALETDVTLVNTPNVSMTEPSSDQDAILSEDSTKNDKLNGVIVPAATLNSKANDSDIKEVDKDEKNQSQDVSKEMPALIAAQNINGVPESPIRNVDSPSRRNSNSIGTPSSETKGVVKGTAYGTPVINAASHYLKLPKDENFAKDICDVINFENLPNSTGKYKKICHLLKKVKSEVDRIQDS